MSKSPQAVFLSAAQQARLSVLVFFASMLAGAFADSDWLVLAFFALSVIALAVFAVARWRLDRIAEARHKAGLQREGN